MEHLGVQEGIHDQGSLGGIQGVLASDWGHDRAQASWHCPRVVLAFCWDPFLVHLASSYPGVLPCHRVVAEVACQGQGSLGVASCICPCEAASLGHHVPVQAYQGVVDNLGEDILACQEDHWVAAGQVQAAAEPLMMVWTLVCQPATAGVTMVYWSLSWSWKVTEESWDPAWDCWPLRSGVGTCRDWGPPAWSLASPSAPAEPSCYWRAGLG